MEVYTSAMFEFKNKIPLVLHITNIPYGLNRIKKKTVPIDCTKAQCQLLNTWDAYHHENETQFQPFLTVTGANENVWAAEDLQSHIRLPEI